MALDSEQRHGQDDPARILDQVSTVAQEHGLLCETVTVTEAAAEPIVKTADSKQCDLIVMSSHGRRDLARVLLGSQAMRVLTFFRSSADLPVTKRGARC